MNTFGRDVRSKSVGRTLLLAVFAASSLYSASVVRAQDVSAPAMLQWFEGTYNTIERRTADFHAAGYGGLWTPPPGRADSGNQSVGYDQYDRFDLGKAGTNKSGWTLYGTERGLKTTVASIQKTGGAVYLDLVLNHSGFRDISTTGFNAGGGYPGFTLSAPGTSDGDYHSAFASGDLNGRLAGLIDIAQETNNQYIRSPVVTGDSRNIPGGAFANFATEANRRFYQNRSGPADRFLFDPKTGETNIPVWDFDSTSATQGTPVTENAMGYLMRNTQWLVQEIGVNGFRLDATKHVPTFALNYFDRAVYKTSTKVYLNGQQENVFSFGEYFDGNPANVQPSIRKDINPSDPGRVGGNRDALDFTLYYAMQSNLSGSNFGNNNNWNNVINSSLDAQDDGLANNGSQSVSFVNSHDWGDPDLANVAYAYTLMRPGNTVVYYNAQEFGTGRSFPLGGRGDALGGQFGTTITRLVDIRNRYGRGNFLPRLTEQRVLIFERDNSLVAAYNNSSLSGFDERTVATNFAPGTPLVELTGNATDITVDPLNDIRDFVTVSATGSITIRVPRNTNPNNSFHGKGYVIYGPASPQGTLTLTNVNNTIAPDTATSGTNGTARINSVRVIKANTFQIQLQTTPVTIPGYGRDVNADGDFAQFKVDAGVLLNGTSSYISTTPNNVSYGFQTFTTTNSPLVGGGTGLFVQTIDTSQLSEGYHYLEARAFRKRNASEPPIYSSWKQTIYVDRLAPNSGIDSFSPIVTGNNANRRAIARSIDQTANNVHILLDIPANLTNAEVIAMLSGTTNGALIDRDQWQRDFSNLTSGNHALTVVTFEETGTSNVQRYPGFSVSSTFGAGLADLDFNNIYTSNDMTLFAAAYRSNNKIFNPAGDLDADGYITYIDLILLGGRLSQVNASPSVWAAYDQIIGSAVPEPTTAATALIAAPALLLRRRRSTSKQSLASSSASHR